MPGNPKKQFAKSKTALGALLVPKCGDRWVTTLLGRGMPAKGPDGYDVAACQAWCAENRTPKKAEQLAAAISAVGVEGLTPRQAAELRKIVADAEWRELRNKKAANEVVDAADVQYAVGEFCIAVRDRLQAIPDEICVGLAPEMRTDLMREWGDKIIWILTQMSHWQQDHDCFKGLFERMQRFDAYERDNPPPKIEQPNADATDKPSEATE